MRISEVIGMRIYAKRKELGWSQPRLGTLIGYVLEKEWSRQAVSAAEKGKRQFTAAELVAFASVLDVSMSYLLMPPPGSGQIEYEPGVPVGARDLERALDIYRGMSSQEAAFAEAGTVFFQHLGELREAADRVRADLDHMVSALGVPPSLREERDAAEVADIEGLLSAVDRRRKRDNGNDADPEQP